MNLWCFPVFAKKQSSFGGPKSYKGSSFAFCISECHQVSLNTISDRAVNWDAVLAGNAHASLVSAHNTRMANAQLLDSLFQ